MDDDKQLLRKRRVLYFILEVVLSSSQLTYGLMAHLRDSRVSILLVISGSLGVLPILCTFFLSSHVPVHLYSLDMLMSLIVMLSGVLDINVALTYKTRFPYQVFVSIGLLYIMVRPIRKFSHQQLYFIFCGIPRIAYSSVDVAIERRMAFDEGFVVFRNICVVSPGYQKRVDYC